MGNNKTVVVNRRKDAEDVYIGRGSPFGNPFVRPSTLSAYSHCVFSEDPIRDYELWLSGRINLKDWPRPTPGQIASLRGKRLGCFCKPKPCHGDVLARMAERADVGG